MVNNIHHSSPECKADAFTLLALTNTTTAAVCLSSFPGSGHIHRTGVTIYSHFFFTVSTQWSCPQINNTPCMKNV